MSTLGNIIWLIFGGLLSSLGYILGGVLLCVTIVGIPFGVQSVRLGLATLAPFGRRVVVSEKARSPLRILFDVLWLILAGWLIALNHLLSAVILAITIIGLPFAKQHLKLIPVALFPFGRELE